MYVLSYPSMFATTSPSYLFVAPKLILQPGSHPQRSLNLFLILLVDSYFIPVYICLFLCSFGWLVGG